MRVTGMIFSMGMTLLILSIYIGRVQMTPETYPDYMRCTRVAFLFFSALCFGGVFASLARGKIR